MPASHLPHIATLISATPSWCAEDMPLDCDWNYHMRRQMQLILPGLYLGPYSSAVSSSRPVLLQTGITHIICIRHRTEANVIKTKFTDIIRYLVLDIADSSNENILRFFPEANNFIQSCLASGGKCLVHGNAGISRSATIVMAYAMQSLNISYKEAFKFVQSRRYCVGPNASFLMQLAEFEPIYKASQTEGPGNRPKRKFNEVDNV